jgi:hypothetical protein
VRAAEVSRHARKGVVGASPLGRREVLVIELRYFVTMRWHARPEGNNHQLRVAPQLDSWDKAGDPAQVRLRPFLDDTEALLAASRIDDQWALRLDVERPTSRDLLDGADLDNYAFPLARRLDDPVLLPEPPAADLVELLQKHQVGCVVESGAGQFTDMTTWKRCP